MIITIFLARLAITGGDRVAATAGSQGLAAGRLHVRAPGVVGVAVGCHQGWISKWAIFVVTLICTPMRSDQATRDIGRKKVEHLSDQAQRTRIGQIEDAAQTVECHDIPQQEADLTADHSILRHTGLVTVTAETVEDLDSHVATFEQAAIQANCETRFLVARWKAQPGWMHRILLR